MSEIQDTKVVWQTISNTDLTEGKGHSIILYTCELKTTALRLGYKKYVMGSNCPVYESTAYRINGLWYIKHPITQPSTQDIQQHTTNEKVNAVWEKAKFLGLSAEEIEILKN